MSLIATRSNFLCANGRNLGQGLVLALCMNMGRLFETALADAAYWQDFERLQELFLR